MCPGAGCSYGRDRRCGQCRPPVNIAGIALASTGILSPIAAAIIHNVASAMVVLNSSRLLLFKSNI
ncbi:hypothetical protein D2962_15725 [Biomaibacter acetigenes]|uniref:Uncharacterized protein n=1 Tax=Biomaibacter acetigenes TaxID=2316383 RepID=A0A3G2R8Q7_9FIRM|nr:hypothetical protein D2962_15725 [Biomaibacter acetigenes]